MNNHFKHNTSQAQQQHQHQQQIMILEAFPTLSSIRDQVLTWLTNSERGALFDTCHMLRQLKQTEYWFCFTDEASCNYYIDDELRAQVHKSAARGSVGHQGRLFRNLEMSIRSKEFRERVHESAARVGHQGRLFRNLEIFIHDNDEVIDASPFAEVRKLTLNGCRNLNNVSALGGVEELKLSYCHNITDVSMLGGVKKLELHNCACIIDVSALGGVEELSLSSCPNITDVSMLGALSL